MKTNSWHWYRILIIVIPVIMILAALLILQPWNSSLKTQVMLAKTEAATSSVQSYRMSFISTGSSQDQDLQATIEAEYSAPDHYYYKQNLAGSQPLEFIVIGDNQYVKNPDIAPSTITAILNSLLFMVNQKKTSEIMDGLTGVQRLPDETIEGVSCLHYQGTADIEKQIAEEKRSIQEANAKAGIQMSDEDLDKIFERMQAMKVEVELWIGKADYLIRQLTQNEQIPDKNSGIITGSITYKYFDFNQPIEIGPPTDVNGNLLPGWNLAGSITPDSKLPVFTAGISSTIGGQPGYDDPAHQQISYHISITNQSSETLENVGVTLSTMATNDEQKPLVIEGQPETAGHVEFTPGDSETYNITWNYDGSQNTKEEIINLAKQTTITVEFTTQDGRNLTQSLLPENASTPAPSSGTAGE